jgi:hypothetical protein
MTIDTDLALDAEDIGYDPVAAVRGNFGREW